VDRPHSQGRNTTAVGANAPRYGRIKEYLRKRIGAGDWPPGTAIPTEAALMKRFGVSRMTAHRAVRDLTAEGLLTRTPGRGTFVTELQPISSFLRIRSIHEEIGERGHRHDTEVLLTARERTTRDVAELLEIERGMPAFHIVLVHRENGVPIQLEDRYVVAALLPDLLERDFTAVTPTEVLFEHFPLSEAEHIVEAALADRATARVLGIAAGEAVLVVKRRTWSRGRLTTAARLTHPASIYRLIGRFKP
jgi:GntR family transcriptional regulator, histidine utilization repressor